MINLEKPDFSFGEGGWVDPNFFPEELKRELLDHLNTSLLSLQQREELISFASQMAQFALPGEVITAQKQRDQIEKIAKDARRLLTSMNSLSAPAKEALHAHTDYLVYGSTPPMQLQEHIKESIKHSDGGLLSHAWDWVEALEAASEYAMEQFTPDTTSKPLLNMARGYVSMVAQRIHSMTGKLPPKSGASWFAAFVTRLGEHLSLPIGPRVVESGVEEVRCQLKKV